MNRKKTAAILAVLLSGLMLTACGKNNSADNSQTGSESGSSASSGSTGSTGSSTNGRTGDIDGDGFVEDIVSDAGDIVTDIVGGAEDIVDDIVPHENDNPTVTTTGNNR